MVNVVLGVSEADNVTSTVLIPDKAVLKSITADRLLEVSLVIPPSDDNVADNIFDVLLLILALEVNVADRFFIVRFVIDVDEVRVAVNTLLVIKPPRAAEDVKVPDSNLLVCFNIEPELDDIADNILLVLLIKVVEEVRVASMVCVYNVLPRLFGT